jgi:hypothetical protein
VHDCPGDAGGDGAPDVGSLVSALESKLRTMKKDFREIRARYESGGRAPMKLAGIGDGLRSGC